jgi:hypothetical protein
MTRGAYREAAASLEQALAAVDRLGGRPPSGADRELGVPLAAGVLYPVSGRLLSPMVASAAMTVSSVSVIASALRLRRVAL